MKLIIALLAIVASIAHADVTLYDGNGIAQGYILDNGTITNAQGTVLGRIDAAGRLYEADGTLRGQAAGGQVQTYDNNNRPAGSMDRNGQMYDSQNRPAGSVGRDGTIYDDHNLPVGRIGNPSLRNRYGGTGGR